MEPQKPQAAIVKDHPRGHRQGSSNSSSASSPRTSPDPSQRVAAAAAAATSRDSNTNSPISASSTSNKMGLVTIFTKENCEICEAAKDELMIHNIPYQEITLDASENQPVPELFLNNDPVPGGLEELVNLIEQSRRIQGELQDNIANKKKKKKNTDDNNNNSSSSSIRRGNRTVLQDDSHSYYDPMGESSRRSHNDSGMLGASHRSFYDPMGESRKSIDSDEDLSHIGSLYPSLKDDSIKFNDSMTSITETEDLFNSASITNHESYSTAYSRERFVPEHSRSFQDFSRRPRRAHSQANLMYDNSHRSLSFEDALQISKTHQSSRNLHHYSSSSNNNNNHDNWNDSNQSLSTDDIMPPSEVALNDTSTTDLEDSMPALMPVSMSSSSRLTSSSSMNNSSRLNSSLRLTNIRRRMQDSSSTMHSAISTLHESLNNSMSSSTRTASASAPLETQTPIELPNKQRKVSILDAIKELKRVLPCSDKKYGLTVYRNVFTGSEAIDALREHYKLSRPEATALGVHLHQSTLIHHVSHEHEFEDNHKYFYRLQCHHTPDILNSYCIWTHQETRTKHGKVVIEKLLNESLQQMFEAIADPATGKLNYKQASSSSDLWDDLQYQVCELQLVNLARMDKTSLLAFALNVYQLFWHFALMKVGIPTTSAARSAFMTQVKFNVGGDIYSFSDWWNGILRGNRKSPYGGGPPFKKQGKDPRIYLSLPTVDPRIHFAAAMTQLTRPLKVYTATNLDKELQLAANAFCSIPDFLSLDMDTKTLKLHHCFDAYTSDFAPGGSGSKALPKAIIQWLPRQAQKQFEYNITALGKSLKVVFLKDNDWSHHAAAFEPFDETKDLKADTKRLLTKSNSLRRMFAS